jgi:hypothetical protein
MPNIEDIFNNIKGEVADLAVKTVNEFKDQAIADAAQFLEDSKEDLEEYAKDFAAGKMTKAELELLLRSKLALAKMALLKQEGLAAVRVDTFKNDVLKIVVDTVGGLI